KHFENGWNIKPDVVVEMPKAFELPATGTINYKYIVVKTNFPEDMWVVAAEMRPGNAAVLHHGKVWVRPPGSNWLKNARPGDAYEMETQRDIIGRNASEEGNDILGKYNPGLGAQRFDQEGAAKFVPQTITPSGEKKTVLKGKFDFEWQMGYQLAEALPLPTGTKLRFITHFDNSPANRFNPDPTKKIVWGPQNWDEMSNCFIGVL